jgi:hypothetical protein
VTKRKPNKGSFGRGNAAAKAARGVPKTGRPTHVAVAAIKDLLTMARDGARDGGKKEDPATRALSIHDKAVIRLAEALDARDAKGKLNSTAMNAIELVLAYVHGDTPKSQVHTGEVTIVVKRDGLKR